MGGFLLYTAAPFAIVIVVSTLILSSMRKKFNEQRRAAISVMPTDEYSKLLDEVMTATQDAGEWTTRVSNQKKRGAVIFGFFFIIFSVMVYTMWDSFPSELVRRLAAGASLGLVFAIRNAAFVLDDHRDFKRLDEKVIEIWQAEDRSSVDRVVVYTPEQYSRKPRDKQ